MQLIRQGYRKTSNKHCMVSRIDRPDWVSVLAKDMFRSEAEFYEKGCTEPSDHWADHYRRVYSKDTVVIPQAYIREFPSSGHDPVGFIPLLKDDIIWTTKDGREVEVRNMDNGHLHNTILMIDRYLNDGVKLIGKNKNLAETLKRMEEERTNRGMPLPLIPIKSLAYIKGEIT